MFRKLRNLTGQSVKEPIYSAGDIASLTGLTKKQVTYRLKKLAIEPIVEAHSLRESSKGKLLYKKEVIGLVKNF